MGWLKLRGGRRFRKPKNSPQQKATQQQPQQSANQDLNRNDVPAYPFLIHNSLLPELSQTPRFPQKVGRIYPLLDNDTAIIIPNETYSTLGHINHTAPFDFIYNSQKQLSIPPNLPLPDKADHKPQQRVSWYRRRSMIQLNILLLLLIIGGIVTGALCGKRKTAHAPDYTNMSVDATRSRTVDLTRTLTQTATLSPSRLSTSTRSQTGSISIVPTPLSMTSVVSSQEPVPSSAPLPPATDPPVSNIPAPSPSAEHNGGSGVISSSSLAVDSGGTVGNDPPDGDSIGVITACAIDVCITSTIELSPRITQA